ncbi:hypothetical protein D9619_007117 [Psilocybe cf. subviscida]|uniref:Queuosine 5'-phosphate N-glycosylase/hydrolase n=1 Tax=Psilocybe cf. subviscida TaxID=2480587 RepID=A0A8H5EWN5_9AGAR|nr:hypothetical protein D9619_007117 [Psilocybe cf. subviscida]
MSQFLRMNAVLGFLHLATSYLFSTFVLSIMPVATSNPLSSVQMSEKATEDYESMADRNPVVESSEYAYRGLATNLVQVNGDGVKQAARHIRHKLLVESYTPRTWRTHPLHICPPDARSASASEPERILDDSLSKSVLDWIFLISALNFSFWSPLEGRPERYGVEWWAGWDDARAAAAAEEIGQDDCGSGSESGSEEAHELNHVHGETAPSASPEEPQRKVHTGYWALVAALDRALEEDIPITTPSFYASEAACPDSLIAHVFRAASQSSEEIPLLTQRIAIMREVGFILCNSFGGTFKGFIDEFHRIHDGQGSALDLVKMVAATFPSFRDEVYYEGHKVCLWKRAQILVAETWAAFYPAPPSSNSTDTSVPAPTLIPASPHPIFPSATGPCISALTMFADYRVPQILHHLRILTYPSALLRKLHAHTPLAPGSREEVSLRAASIVAVERVRVEILSLMAAEERSEKAVEEGTDMDTVSSVLIDFYLWDLAKKVESGEEKIEGIQTAEMVPIHRTRSIWY